MSSSFDLLIRNGRIVDGTGAEPFHGSIAVRDGAISAVGQVEGTARREIDAEGLLVTPGFVDIHTHYDGQVTWGHALTPSSVHGVTTAVMGNCGVGFAPCRPADRERLVRLMEGVEDIPHPVLAQGLPWNWETFPDYLDRLSERQYDIDFAAQLPHGALRVYVMGERGANREPASPDDVSRMAQLAQQAVSAGALGFTTSRTMNHRTSDGEPTPTLTAEQDELVGIAMALGEIGEGVLQVVSDFRDRINELRIFRTMVQQSGRPLSISLTQHNRSPQGWRAILEFISRANADGLPVRAQVAGRPVGVLFGLELTHNPFSAHPSYRAIADRPFAQRLQRLRDPAFQARLLAEQPELECDPFMKRMYGNFDNLYLLDERPDYEPSPSASLGARARERGSSVLRLALDIMTAGDGRAMLYYPVLNYAEHSLEPSLEMMRHPHTILGLGDGGAHCGTICDASFTTHMLTHWARDRSRGERLPLPWVVKAHAQSTAAAVGLMDRGVLATGYKADINLIDFQRLSLRRPEVRYDLPAGGRRLMQTADGYVATIVSGEVVYQNGEATGELPGRLVRGRQARPAQSAQIGVSGHD
ncbi:MAG TPA: amidohydrolase family protein [Steroidobacteraceae bacterium]|jgi:N-acyl-D-aspartate/D-glutamate deacylase|nr:amidohydrolase family protein [Steroidobacteraceae bacterium]